MTLAWIRPERSGAPGRGVWRWGESDSVFRNEDSIRKVYTPTGLLIRKGREETEEGTSGQESGLGIPPVGASGGTEYWGAGGGLCCQNLYVAPYKPFLLSVSY